MKTGCISKRIESEDIEPDRTDVCDKQPLGLDGFEAISGICLNLICTAQEARKASLSQAATQGHEL